MDSKLSPNHSDDLSYWEIVNSSDAEDSVDGDIGSWSSLSDDESEERILTIVEVESLVFDENRDVGEVFDDLEQEMPIVKVESVVFDENRDKVENFNDSEDEMPILEVESLVFYENRDKVENCNDSEDELPIIEVESPFIGENRDKVENFNESEEEMPIIGDDRSEAENFDEIRTQESPIVEFLDQYGVESDEEDESADDLDDELMPWGYMDRIGRERMRKLGKRSFAKMSKMKKISYTFNRAGCVRGKHGLGLKHSL